MTLCKHEIVQRIRGPDWTFWECKAKDCSERFIPLSDIPKAKYNSEGKYPAYIPWRKEDSGIMTDTTSVRCTICTTQKMAEVSGTGLRIRAHAHGEQHEVSLSPRETLERLTGTVDGSAIVNFVRGMVSC